MAIILRRTRQFTMIISQFYRGNYLQLHGRNLNSSAGISLYSRRLVRNYEQQRGYFAAIHDLKIQIGNSGLVSNSKETGAEQTGDRKEPYTCSFMRNLLLYSPGGISVDERGNRLFLSDSLHHRIIVFNGEGKVLDCIGSSPGFEDGEFECAKLQFPAASYYDDSEGCLYVVDSENHAIRRADLRRRVVETFYPLSKTNQRNSGIWTWLMNKVGLGRDVDTEPMEFDSTTLVFPWHFIKTADSDFLIINRNFKTLWIMDSSSVEIKEEVQGTSKILEAYGHMIAEKASLSKQLPSEWLQQQMDSCIKLEGISNANLMSSLAAFKDHIVVCDSVHHQVVKFNTVGTHSNFHFSNLGNLGLPYWLPSTLERVYTIGDVLHGLDADHTESFNLLPGRVDIKINLHSHEEIEFVGPLQEGCIWRQTRGAAVEVSEAGRKAASVEKVSGAQVFADELDNLAFLTPELEPAVEEDNTRSGSICQDDGIHIDCSVNTSPGTSEVIIYAALYLRLRRCQNKGTNNWEKNAARIAKILMSKQNTPRKGQCQCTQFLLNTKQDLADFIFMRPLHVRIKLDTLDHPKAANNRDIILTDSSIKVDVLLNS